MALPLFYKPTIFISIKFYSYCRYIKHHTITPSVEARITGIIRAFFLCYSHSIIVIISLPLPHRMPFAHFPVSDRPLQQGFFILST